MPFLYANYYCLSTCLLADITTLPKFLTFINIHINFFYKLPLPNNYNYIAYSNTLVDFYNTLGSSEVLTS